MTTADKLLTLVKHKYPHSDETLTVRMLKELLEEVVEDEQVEHDETLHGKSYDPNAAFKLKVGDLVQLNPDKGYTKSVTSILRTVDEIHSKNGTVTVLSKGSSLTEKEDQFIKLDIKTVQTSKPVTFSKVKIGQIFTLQPTTIPQPAAFVQRSYFPYVKIEKNLSRLILREKLGPTEPLLDLKIVYIQKPKTQTQ